ncbi:ciliary neurotrophic factor [Columba livia]|uniref:Ciliary neurotrophic factor n=1 Tax=Columba livia TaxID=8932 RepID=A0A2I0LIJ0_COLLI|nr:ciliary neurotrophic factor [Columba livia]PKK17250.1 ciliary neurotrophic factor [Columba livia]
MAAPDSPSAALQRRDLCSRGIRLVGKMRSDVVDLLDAYVERQGLDASASVAAVEGVPAAAAERWDEQTGTQRLLENLAAYRAFRALLAQMLEEQREQLGEADAALGRALAAGRRGGLVSVSLSQQVFLSPSLVCLVPVKPSAFPRRAPLPSSGRALADTSVSEPSDPRGQEQSPLPSPSTRGDLRLRGAGPGAGSSPRHSILRIGCGRAAS